jgi:hypothetical protein
MNFTFYYEKFNEITAQQKSDLVSFHELNSTIFN